MLRSSPWAGTSVTQTIYGAGYGSSSRFYEEATPTLGMTPTEYKGGADGQTIRTGFAHTDLGCVLVAATDRGICAIELGDDEATMRNRVRERFPNARFIDADDHFGLCLAAVVDSIEVPRRGLSLPLDIQGTAFQQRVWEALRAIPPGATTTYGELARRIGRPKAARAVATACAANPFAVTIPCHRVVRRDGDPGGYRWGDQRKRMLLNHEAATTAEYLSS